jgi:hypothetical protein
MNYADMTDDDAAQFRKAKDVVILYESQLRDHFATAALTGLLAHSDAYATYGDAASEAYGYAAAMLAERAAGEVMTDTRTPAHLAEIESAHQRRELDKGLAMLATGRLLLAGWVAHMPTDAPDCSAWRNALDLADATHTAIARAIVDQELADMGEAT